MGLLRHKSHFVQHLLGLNLLAERWIRIPSATAELKSEMRAENTLGKRLKAWDHPRHKSTNSQTKQAQEPNDKELSGLLKHKSHSVLHLLALNLLAERRIRIHLQRLIVTLPSHFGSEAPLYSTKSGQIWQPQALFMIERSSSS